VNVVVQRGASGSPAFLSESGEVVGVLYAGLNDPRITLGTQNLYTVPTNISYVVPSHYLHRTLEELEKLNELEAPSDARTLEEMLQGATYNNALESRQWEIRQVDPQAEAAKVSTVSRLTPGARQGAE
jgi:S1-C subfamily serine protease